MKKREICVVALGAVLLIAAGVFSVEAFPTQTNPCGNCHTTTGVLVLTSNATGTVDATVGVPFVLMLNQTGYSGGDGKVAIAIRSGWSDNDQFSFTEQGVEDGVASDLNPTSDQVTVAIELTPLSAGSWTVRVWTAGKSGMVGTSLDISVAVSAATSTTTTPTTTEPTSSSPTTPTTSTGTSPPTQPGNPDIMTIALVGVGAIVVIIIIAVIAKRDR
ncbi:MAG: hypothetical protein ACFFBJ_11345 [Promethearchaeota archaeon]